MKKVIATLLLFLSVFFLFSVKGTFAKVITSDKDPIIVAKGEVVNDDLFIGGNLVEIAGTVNGDVFVGGQNIKISGTVNGNLHAGANTIDITGTVKGNVYGGAQNIMVSSSNIGGSLLVGAATVAVDKDSVIVGSLLAGAASLSIDSQVKRSIYAGAGNMTIGDNAVIGRDLYYASGENQANISKEAKITGSVYKSEVETPEKDVKVMQKQAPTLMRGFKFGSELISFIGALIIGFLYFKFFPKSLAENSKFVTGSFWKSLGTGFFVTIALIPGLLILLITVVGIPVAGVAITLFALYSYLAKIIVGSALGNWLSPKLKLKTSVYGALALGLFAFYILKMIPFVGGLAGVVVLWSGLGALTLRMFSKSE